jgi:hypothetical protein
MQVVDVKLAALYMKFLAALRLRHKTLVLASGEKMRLRINDTLAGQLLAEKWFEPTIREKLRHYVHTGATVVDIISAPTLATTPFRRPCW